MYIELDDQGPLYGQLLRSIKSSIVNGRFVAGSQLPATRILAQELGLSRNTILSAYEQLRAEGFIEGRAGSGCYVSQGFQTSLFATGKQAKRSAFSGVLSAQAKRSLEVYDQIVPGHQHKGLRYNLQYGLPMANPALVTAWRRALAYAASRAETDYPDPQGLRFLREQVCDYLKRRRGVMADPDEVMIVSGAQQALSLAAEVLLDPTETVVLENPHYQGMRHVFQAKGAILHGCRVDQDGMMVSELPVTGKIKLISVTPSHQFPTGAVLSLSRRVELLAYADAHQSWVIEDDYDGEFRYNAHPLAALKALDGNERVIYIGSFSKVIFPSLRLGYLVLPNSLRPAFVAAKWLNDRGCPSIEQIALAKLMATGGFERHLRRTAQVLKLRRSALLEGLQHYAKGKVQVADSNAGMHVLGWLPGFSNTQCDQLIANARTSGLGLYSLSPYSLQPLPTPGLLFGYADLPPTDLLAAMRLFGKCLL